ncbi:MAG: response regulator [Kiritimatiellaeota bacterium]|nr:response regulator [Kiritimatiellota bacterium]
MPRRVLVVEDNLVNRKLMEVLLKAGGYEVVTATNGVEGLEKAIGEPFDAILMDVQMPVMDGVTAALKIREWEAKLPPPGRHVPIIAVTAHVMKWNRDQCIRAGMDDFLAKPITKKSALHILRKWTDPTVPSQTLD